MFAQMSQKPTSKLKPESLKRALRLFIPHKKLVTSTLIVVLLGVALGIAPPLLLQHIVDAGFSKNDYHVVWTFSLYTIGATLVAALLTLLYGYWSVLIGQRIMHDLRVTLYRHLQGMALRFFTSTRTGEIQTRLISDVSGVQAVVSTSLVDAISNVAIVITTLVAMMILDWRLTVLAVGLVPLFMWMGQGLGNWARDIRKGTQEQTAEINSMMQETLSVSGALLIKTSGRREQLSTKFEGESYTLSEWQIKAQVMTYIFFGLMRMITAVIPALVYWLAGYFMIIKGDHSITVGKLIAFTMLQTRMFFPLTGIMNTQVEVMSSFALFERIFEYLDMKQEIVNPENPVAVSLPTIKGDVQFKDVHFKYEEEQENWTLNDVSLHANPGDLIALVGHSGSGKTTLSYMIPRLYDVVTGEVKIDGVNVKDYSLEDLSNMIGVVTQETYLIHDTLRENLRFAKPDASDDELIEACKSAAIWDHISSLPEGLDTVVGERGYKFSGGEKQRIAIARALLKNPRILILDEATSALDTASERVIQNSLDGLMTGRTTFAIAHRLSTILHADQILVMEKGVVVERGKHEELLAKEGTYKALYNEQFRAEAELQGVPSE